MTKRSARWIIWLLALAGCAYLKTVKAWYAAIVAGVVSLYAMQRLPYHEYAVLHWAIFISAGVAAYLYFREKATAAAVICAVVAIAFNPIFPARHSRADWVPVNLASGIVLLALVAYSIYRQRRLSPKTGL